MNTLTSNVGLYALIGGAVVALLVIVIAYWPKRSSKAMPKPEEPMPSQMEKEEPKMENEMEKEMPEKDMAEKEMPQEEEKKTDQDTHADS